MTGRLPSGLVASGLIRAAETVGGNGAVLSKGDADSGAIVLVLTCRGRTPLIMERVPRLDGGLQWNRRKGSESVNFESVARFIDELKRFDRDIWVVELDIADVEQFIVDSLGQT